MRAPSARTCITLRHPDERCEQKGRQLGTCKRISQESIVALPTTSAIPSKHLSAKRRRQVRSARRPPRPRSTRTAQSITIGMDRCYRHRRAHGSCAQFSAYRHARECAHRAQSHGESIRACAPRRLPGMAVQPSNFQSRYESGRVPGRGIRRRTRIDRRLI